MLKSVIAGLTALSVSFTPVPAAALTDEEVSQIILGLLAVGVVGKLIHNNSNQDAVPDKEIPRFDGQRSHERRQQPRQNARLLPRECLQTIDTQRGPQRIYGSRCLSQMYRHANNLPQQCVVRVRGYEGPRRGFDPMCLREHGYRTRRH